LASLTALEKNEKFFIFYGFDLWVNLMQRIVETLLFSFLSSSSMVAVESAA
jgi:hypothetical protein